MAHGINFSPLPWLKLLILLELPYLKGLTDRTHSPITDRNVGYAGRKLGEAVDAMHPEATPDDRPGQLAIAPDEKRRVGRSPTAPVRQDGFGDAAFWRVARRRSPAWATRLLMLVLACAAPTLHSEGQVLVSEVVSREASLSVVNGSANPYPQAVSREMSTL